MIAKCSARHIRMSSRKLRDVGRLIACRPVPQALAVLALTNRRAAGVVTKALRSAIANARQQHPNVSELELRVSRVVVQDGPTWSRWRPASMGRAVGILKRTSHITIELDAAGSAKAVAPQRAVGAPAARREHGRGRRPAGAGGAPGRGKRRAAGTT